LLGVVTADAETHLASDRKPTFFARDDHTMRVLPFGTPRAAMGEETMPTTEEINSIDYWKEQKQLAHLDCVRARDAHSRQQALDLVAEAERQIERIKQEQAVASCVGSPVEEGAPSKT
jgi:hypothetical protein